MLPKPLNTTYTTCDKISIYSFAQLVAVPVCTGLCCILYSFPLFFPAAWQEECSVELDHGHSKHSVAGLAMFGKHLRAFPMLFHSQGIFAHQLVLASMFSFQACTYTPSRFCHCCLCRCNQWQRASAGCTDFCACANTNTCTRSQLSAPTCAGCTAWPVEFCNDFRSNRIIIGIIVSALPAVQTACYVICILCN